MLDKAVAICVVPARLNSFEEIICVSTGVSFIFEAKRVPMHLLTQINNTREFHRADWDSVKVAVYGDVFEFDYYFEFVVEEVNRLNALWKIETP